MSRKVILTREESRPSTDTIKRHVTSRPIPLEYLRISSTLAPPQTRRERSEHGSSLALRNLRGEARSTYPLTFWHASAPGNRRYTLYAASEGVRNKWIDALAHAVTVRRAYSEANMVRVLCVHVHLRSPRVLRKERIVVRPACN